MAKRNRETLKKRFGDGEMPSSSDFGDLIESVLNIHDDGIAHNEHDGLRLTQVGSNRRVLSLYGAVEERGAAWGFGLDQHRATLTLEVARHGHAADGPAVDDDDDGGGHAVLTMLAPSEQERNAWVGVNNRHPRCELDVDGVVAYSGRMGADGASAAPADAEWHTIAGPFQGCTALEVMAGAGRPHTGKYALMHAFALRTFTAKGEFTYHQAHYDSRRHRMELRWLDSKEVPGDYCLQVRVNCAYGADTWIRYQLTTLWFDPQMTQCGVPPVQQERP